MVVADVEVASLRDEVERLQSRVRELERQLRLVWAWAEERPCLGGAARDVAHRLNNDLSPLVVMAELARDLPNVPTELAALAPDAVECLDAITNSVARLQEVGRLASNARFVPPPALADYCPPPWDAA